MSKGTPRTRDVSPVFPQTQPARCMDPERGKIEDIYTRRQIDRQRQGQKRGRDHDRQAQVWGLSEGDRWACCAQHT